MTISLCEFAAAWNLGFCFFLDPTTSLRILLDWDHHNADGTRIALGYGVENFRLPHRFFHERSETAFVTTTLASGPTVLGVAGPEPTQRRDLLLEYWLAASRYSPVGSLRLLFLVLLHKVLAPRPYYSPLQHPVFEFQGRVEDYPQEWSLGDIVHQHFLACAWLGFWCVEERGPARWPVQICWLWRPSAMTLPSVYDKLLDRMLLTFETHMAEYCQSQDDPIEEDHLRKQLFEFVLNMERILFWLNRLGFWVAWSVHYDQLLERLFPDVLLDFPPEDHRAEFTRLRASLFFSRHPDSVLPENAQSSINPLDAPVGIARLRLLPWDSHDVRSGFQPTPSSNVSSARGAAIRFSMAGVLEYLHSAYFLSWVQADRLILGPELASSDGRWVDLAEGVVLAHILVGDELDSELLASGLPPNDFLGATLSTPPPPAPSHRKRPKPDQARPTRKRTPTEPRADREANQAGSSVRPPNVRIPPARMSFVAERDPSQHPRSFPLEGFRPH